MFEELKDKVVLITGSNGGIGEQTVQLFAANDCKVVVTGRTAANVERVAQLCEAKSPSKHKPLKVICDLKCSDDVNKLVKATVDGFGRIDVLVNVVAHYQPMNILDGDILKNFDDHVSLNVRSVMQLCRLTLPYLIESKGCIVNVSTIGTRKPFKNCISYCATKAAVDMLTKVLALEFGPQGVRVNCVNLGPIDTPQFKSFPNSNEIRKHAAEKGALKRMGEVNEVAQTILFLASNASSFVTGSFIPVDGGTSLA